MVDEEKMGFRALSFIRNFKDFVQIVFINIVTTDNNQRVYESDDVVTFYLDQNSLQLPETTILNDFRTKLPNMKMLDIGVGAGRTSSHFAAVSKEYIGIDYSSKMIEACLKKFSSSPKIFFLTADARTMKSFEDESFDFILFSFNGIDYMTHEERLCALLEIKRILKSGGYLCFSTHNLNYESKKCSIQLSRHPRIFASRIIQLLQMRLLNKREAWKLIRGSTRKATHTMVNDGAMDYRLETYYITPIAQLKQLNELGFSNTKMYSLTNGAEFKSPENTIDHWIYYLAQVS